MGPGKSELTFKRHTGKPRKNMKTMKNIKNHEKHKKTMTSNAVAKVLCTSACKMLLRLRFCKHGLGECYQNISHSKKIQVHVNRTIAAATFCKLMCTEP